MDRIIFGYDLINGSDEDYDNLINYLRNYLHAVQMNKSVWALTNGRETPESIVNKLISNVKCQIRAFAFYTGSGNVHNLLCPIESLN